MMGRIGAILAPLTPALVSCDNLSYVTNIFSPIYHHSYLYRVTAGCRGVGATAVRAIRRVCTAVGPASAAHSGDAGHAAA